jgi:hypothetical protein
MAHMIDLKWLLVLSLGSMAAFAIWVFCNLTREIRAEKRRWVRTYRRPIQSRSVSKPAHNGFRQR